MTDVVHSQNGPIAVIALDRPDLLNAVRPQSITDMREALGAALGNPATRVVLLTGNGRAFCAGEDLDELAQTLEDGMPSKDVQRSRLNALQGITRLLAGADIPTVAAVNGPAIGFGAELALSCDIRLGDATTSFSFPEARWGLFQTNGVLDLLPRTVGRGVALDWLLSGRKIGAQEALSRGLISQLVDDLREDAAKYCEKIAGNEQLTLALVKAIVRTRHDDRLHEVLDAETDAAMRCLEETNVLGRVGEFVGRRTSPANDRPN